MLLMVSVELPVSVRVAAKGGDEPTRTFPKFRSAGTSFTLPAVIVIVAVTDFEVSVTEVAVSVTVELAGTEAGAVYVIGLPLAVVADDTSPQPVEQGVPFCKSVQATVLFPTVAINC